MGRRSWLAVVPVVLLACRGDDLPAPALRRPVEELPAGATALVLTSDLRNTWERAAGHGLGEILSQLGPFQEFLARPELVRLRGTWDELRAERQIDPQEDLVLNATGNRAGLALYREPGAASGAGELLFVGELADAGRFQRALVGLRTHLASRGWECSDARAGGKPALHLRADSVRGLFVVQDGVFLAVATTESLAARALALHGGASGSALRDPHFQEALRALQPHSITVLEHTAAADAAWLAHGFTWDPTGLHFEQVRAAAARATSERVSQREAILGSLPDGCALAGYLRPGELGLSELLHPMTTAGGVALPDSAGGRLGAGAPALLGALPAGLAGLLGGEGGLIIQGLTPTALAPVPEAGVVLTLRDPAAALSTLRFAEASLGAVRLKGKAYLFEDVQYGGRTFRSFVQPLSEALTPSYLVDGDLAIVTTSRQLMQRIIDTRRTGRRSVLTDAAFKRQHAFVPDAASVVAYGDPQRLDRALAQIEPLLGRWGTDVQHTVRDLRRITPLVGHFPAGAVYAVRETDRLVWRGWLQEGR